jgi:hypothetical protein
VLFPFSETGAVVRVDFSADKLVKILFRRNANFVLKYADNQNILNQTDITN